ncbi:15508_t:CDS:2 [Acaulospora colombiana]|uniref:15508_t:CDS:1 n=1 Tax=Acaulospora colombiana TaxID=27376 RepID=A0ACA9N470_9GLOM|nr:15508_t:CDS:2 [Acaulospora colombiana]
MSPWPFDNSQDLVGSTSYQNYSVRIRRNVLNSHRSADEYDKREITGIPNVQWHAVQCNEDPIAAPQPSPRRLIPLLAFVIPTSISTHQYSDCLYSARILYNAQLLV